MIYGYARVSTNGQAKDGNSLEHQSNELKKAGATKIFRESYTGSELHRPELDKLLETLTSGDMLVVTKLDRIARNTRDGIDIIDSVVEKDCAIRILNMGMFDNTPTGRLMKNVMLAIAEFERDMIVQRTSEGKAIARQKPTFREGRPRKNIDCFQEVLQKQKDGEMTVNQICSHLGISRSTWYDRVRAL